MTSRSFPYTPFTGSPGAYCDALPSGEFVAFLPGERCETHLGAVEFLDQELQPLFVRINPKGPFEFAAVGWEGRQKDHVLTWDGQWHISSDIACGSSPVIYDNHGVLHVSHCEQGVGSQGYRYVTPNNALVTGDATYSPTPTVPLAEWTQLLPDLWVGQGQGDDGVHIVDRGVLHTLATNVGLCRFVRARIDGSRVSVAWWGQGTHTAELRWLTVEEMRALPVLVATPPPLPPVPPPIPPPTPPPIEVPMQIPHDVMATIIEFARVFPPPHGDGGEDYIKYGLQFGWKQRLAEQLRFSHGPAWGNKSTSATSTRSKEAIAYKSGTDLHVWDLLIGAGSGNPVLAADPTYHHVNDQNFIPVAPVDHLNLVRNSPVARPPLPRMKAMSSFDFCIDRDPWWLDFAVDLQIPFQRLIVWSHFRKGRDISFDQALVHLELGLQDLRRRGLVADVTFHTDTREREDTQDDIRDRTRRINDVLVKHLDVVKAARLFNENSHSVEQWFAVDIDFLLELDALVDARIPLAWGAGHGGEDISPTVAGGSWIAHHGDRSKTPEENAQIMRAAQAKYGKPVVNAEPIGFRAIAETGRRVNDLDWARRQAEADKNAGLGGSCFHFEAGIYAEVGRLDDIQRAAGRVFSQTFSGSGPVPPPVPPPTTGHPVLDAPLFPAYPTGYQFFVHNFKAIQDEAFAWYVRAFGREPALSDIAHGLWRALNEGERWRTLRGAFEEAWPGGGPR